MCIERRAGIVSLSSPLNSMNTCAYRRLLVRLCLVREDIDEAAKQLQEAEAVSLYHDMMTTSFRLLPMGNAAYIKEVLGVPNPDKR